MPSLDGAIGWVNSEPLGPDELRGHVVLVNFWTLTCINWLRQEPHVRAWSQAYRGDGLVVIGVHTPEFTFAQYESNVERGIREFGLTYPIVIDSNREIWKAFANRYWPTKYLLDKDGYLRFGHFGEGGYGECEQVIQELLREIDPAIAVLKACSADAERVPNELANPGLIIPGSSHCGLVHHGGAIDEGRAQEHEQGDGRELRLLDARFEVAPGLRPVASRCWISGRSLSRGFA